MSVSGNTSANYQYSNFYGGMIITLMEVDHINGNVVVVILEWVQEILL